MAPMERSATAPATLRPRRRPRSRSDSHDQASPGKLPAELSILDSLSLDLPTAVSKSFDALCSLLLGSITEVEAELKALESEDEDSEDDERISFPFPTEAARQKGALADFTTHARAYIDHVKAELPSIGLPSLNNMPELSELLTSTTAAMPRDGKDVSRIIENITKKLERVHETLTAVISASSTCLTPTAASPSSPTPSARAVMEADALTSTASLSGDNKATARPPLGRRYTIAALYAHVPALPTPFPAIHAFLNHESARFSHLPNMRRPSFSRLNSVDFDDMVARAIHKFEEVADGAKHGLEHIADEAKRELHVLRDEADRVAHALREGATRLLHYHELPEEWKNNAYILSGYRFIPIERWGAILVSAFQWHNETFNIWSHALGAASIIYGIIFIHPYTPQAQSSYPADGLVTLAFLLAAVACMTCSAIWHTFSGCGTSHIFNGCACLDYVGISALISGSIVTMVYYGFYCEPELALKYITFCLACGTSGIFLPFSKWFNERKNKGWRILFFLSLCASAVVPQSHMALKYGLVDTIRFYSPVMLSAMAYVCGLVLYATQFPERMRPGGLFDTVAHSHQFWHVAIVIAVYTHWWATGHMYHQGTEGFSCAVR